MTIILAQSAGVGPLVTVLLAGLAFVFGSLVGYAWGYRFKRQYLAAARQLANLRGENFRGELTTIGNKGIDAASANPPPAAADSARHNANANAEADVCQRCEKLTTELSAQADEIEALRRADAERGDKISQLEASLKESEAQVLAGQAEIEEATARLGAAGASEADSAQAWQIEQLHREQIAMQMKMDEYVEQIAQLNAQISSNWRALRICC